jgi:hypothetical protein
MGNSGIPMSVLDGKVSDAFIKILRYHIKPGSVIIDVTAGQRLLWEGQNVEDYKIYYYDKNIDNEIVKKKDIFIDSYDKCSCIVYDPPYFFGVKKSNDFRKDMYGGYAGTLDELRGYMSAVKRLKESLLPGGKIILKCADQYYVPEKKLYLHHLDWIKHLISSGYNVIDFYVYRHHHVSPTAFQVKNRNSAVIMHTYFIVGEVV